VSLGGGFEDDIFCLASCYYLGMGEEEKVEGFFGWPIRIYIHTHINEAPTT
jgi:hypothetical protein